MIDSIIDVHKGVTFKVEAVPCDGGFEGRFSYVDPALGSVTGSDDTYRPTTENVWATAHEALTYATEAAHHAIEGIRPFD